MGSIITLVIFIAAYLGFVLYSEKRVLIAIISALLLLLSRAISPVDAFWSVNWNVIGIFVGMLVVSNIFTRSLMPAFIAEWIVNRSHNMAWALLSICLLTGFISAFVDNVSTVLIVAPVALSLAKNLKINPTDLMIGIAVSSNLQGCATLIGDPPSMLLGGFAKMNFWDFFFYRGRPSIFFAVELGAIAAFSVLYMVFMHKKKKINIHVKQKILSVWPTVFLVTLILTLAGSSFLKVGFGNIAGLICMAFGVLTLIWKNFNDKEPTVKFLRALDWETTIFLMGIFILVGSVTLTGWVAGVAELLSGLIGGNIFLGYTILVFFSVFVSAFVDNIPFLAAMLPVAMTMSQHLGINPSLFLFGLLIGASLGGNISPIGASANIVATGILKKEGYPVSFSKFASIGLPFTLSAVSIAYIFIWQVWR